MKNKTIIRTLRAISLSLLFFCLIVGDCLAVDETDTMFEVSSENAQLDFYGQNEGVYYIITDPQGRRAGYDIVTKQYLREFPSDFGFVTKDKDPITGREIGGRDEISEKFHGEAMINLEPGTYTVEVIGVDLTSYSFDIAISRRIISEGFTDARFEGVIDKGVTSKFQFTYASYPAKPSSFTRLVAPSTLKDDITLSRKIGWIDNDGVANSLMKKAEAIEAAMARGNKEAARNQLNALVNEIDAQKGKHISSYTEKPGSVYKGINLVPAPKEEDAVELLLDDAAYLLEQLK